MLQLIIKDYLSGVPLAMVAKNHNCSIHYVIDVVHTYLTKGRI